MVQQMGVSLVKYMLGGIAGVEVNIVLIDVEKYVEMELTFITMTVMMAI